MKNEYNTLDFAKYLVNKKNIRDSLSLQKILFLVYYESKINNSIKFFDDKTEFQAWVYGPVNRETYDYFKKFFNGFEEKEYVINENDYHFFDKYIDKYIKLNIWKLVDLTHENIAWINARKDKNGNQIPNDEICENILKDEEIKNVTNKFHKILENN